MPHHSQMSNVIHVCTGIHTHKHTHSVRTGSERRKDGDMTGAHTAATHAKKSSTHH